AIDCVAKLHVVGRHRFGDCAGCAASLEKAKRYFLAGADFGKGAVAFSLEIDLERLFVGSDVHLSVHGFKMWNSESQSTAVPGRIRLPSSWRGCAFDSRNACVSRPRCVSI